MNGAAKVSKKRLNLPLECRFINNVQMKGRRINYLDAKKSRLKKAQRNDRTFFMSCYIVIGDTAISIILKYR